MMARQRLVVNFSPWAILALWALSLAILLATFAG